MDCWTETIEWLFLIREHEFQKINRRNRCAESSGLSHDKRPRGQEVAGAVVN